ncbi:hypothetical protein [uncultured Paludibaculum sp.]|uniref:zinc ribbon domain-containing protein n=1 Tax=uncultured Paludibaculum sp. TaxID=1765020 RepID=UPI002AAAC448|nr:hypothetical protein [uncultured Paludibaculum sp.]
MRWRLTLFLISTAVVAVLVFWPLADLSFKRPHREGDDQVEQAVLRGLSFIHGTAQTQQNFADYGSDYLWCFCAIASSSSDPEVRRRSWEFGHGLALRWRALHSRAEASVGADELYQMVAGSYAAQCLGVPDERIRPALRQAAARMTANEMYGFDPTREPPPGDIPKPCSQCGARNARGSRTCSRCGTRLVLQDRYGVWCDAIIAAFAGERYGVRFGASLADVLQWLPRMRPYPGPESPRANEYEHGACAVTHLVYALNGYSLYRLRPEWLPEEFEFLKSHVRHAIASDDPELLGEYLDTLKSFGLTRKDPLLDSGIRHLLARQNRDGSWGDMSRSDVYERYHPTWTAVDALRDYAWRGEGALFPDVLLRVRQAQSGSRRGQ